jgi:hypothetical protein
VTLIDAGICEMKVNQKIGEGWEALLFGTGATRVRLSPCISRDTNRYILVDTLMAGGTCIERRIAHSEGRRCRDPGPKVLSRAKRWDFGGDVFGHRKLIAV